MRDIHVIHRGLAVVVLLFMFYVTSAGATSPNGNGNAANAHTGGAAEYIAARRCGQNSVYMLMRANGHTTAYENVLREIAESTERVKRGTSLAQLARGATTLGFPCVAKRLASLEELRRATLPLIVHCAGGHYCLLVGLDHGRVTLIDGSSGRSERMSAGDFVHRWTHYVIEPRASARGISGEAIGYLLAAVGIALCACSAISALRDPRAPRRPASRERPFNVLLPSCIALALLGAICNTSAGRPPMAARDWRVPDRDGLNCLYLLLSIADSRVGYGDLIARGAAGATRGGSLNELREAAAAFGMEMTIKRRGPVELTRDRLPLITHIEGARPDGGEFVLLISRSESNVRIIHGNTMGFADISADEFLREWSGFVLEPVTRSFARTTAAAMGAGLCLLGLYLWVRGTQARSMARPVAKRDDPRTRRHSRTENGRRVTDHS